MSKTIRQHREMHEPAATVMRAAPAKIKLVRSKAPAVKTRKLQDPCASTPHRTKPHEHHTKKMSA